MKYIVIFLFLFITGWCTNKQDNPPLAKVGKAVLYKSDLTGLIQPGLTQADSLSMAKSIIEKWIRKQLILQKALLNLTEEEKNVQKEIDEYYAALIIYKYEQKFIKERLDTFVSEEELIKYYNENIDNFILNAHVAKAQFIKLPIAIKTDMLKAWLNQETPESLSKIAEFCYQVALKYEYFNDRWVSLDNIKMLFPHNLEPTDQILLTNKLYETADSDFKYILYFRELRLKGTQAPYHFVRDNIKDIILLKRKQKLINDLENNIYFDALNKNKFDIYD